MSTTKNVRDIISVVENMYESVNSPSASRCEDHVASDQCELSSNDGIFEDNDIKNVKHAPYHLLYLIIFIDASVSRGITTKGKYFFHLLEKESLCLSELKS